MSGKMKKTLMFLLSLSFMYINTYAQLSGAVVFELTDASYTTSETFPITINEIGGASSTNTITIRPATGVTAEISGNSGGDYTSIIKLYGADYEIIDGSNNGTTSRDLTITNTKSSGFSASKKLLLLK